MKSNREEYMQPININGMREEFEETRDKCSQIVADLFNKGVSLGLLAIVSTHIALSTNSSDFTKVGYAALGTVGTGLGVFLLNEHLNRKYDKKKMLEQENELSEDEIEM